MKKLLFRLAILIGFISHICADTVYEYQSACDNADIDGCYHLGLAYARGEGVKQNIELSRDYLQFSCDEGLGDACVALQSLTVGDGTNNPEDKQDNNAKLKHHNLKITCLDNPEDKQDNSAEAKHHDFKITCLHNPEDRKSNNAQSAYLVTKNHRIKEYVLGIIKQGSAQFKYPFGAMPKDMVMGADVEKVAEYISRGMRGEEPPSFAVCTVCHGADGRGDGGMSADLLNLKGVESSGASRAKEDNEMVVHRKACDRGDANTCFDLGLLYEDKRKNYRKAAEYYSKSCDLGDGLGCWYLGSYYEEGKGLERSSGKAMEYYMKACDLGNGASCYLLGLVYLAGDMVKPNQRKVKSYFKKACDRGYSEGCE